MLVGILISKINQTLGEQIYNNGTDTAAHIDHEECAYTEYESANHLITVAMTPSGAEVDALDENGENRLPLLCDFIADNLPDYAEIFQIGYKDYKDNEGWI